VQGLWETNFYRNWTYGLAFMLGNVNPSELSVGSISNTKPEISGGARIVSGCTKGRLCSL
jgi:hypothetical protein